MIATGSPYLVALLDAARNDIAQWMQEKFEFHCGRVGEQGGVTGVVQLARHRLAKPSAAPAPAPGSAAPGSAAGGSAAGGSPGPGSPGPGSAAPRP